MELAMIRVLLVDDHAVLRAGLRLLIDQQSDMAVVGEAAGPAAAVMTSVRLSPDVVVTDLRMPGATGTEFLTQLKGRVVVLTMYDHRSWMDRAREAGALGFVTKSSADTQLLTAIREVAQGRTFMDPRCTREAAKGRDGLSARESEVLRLVALGHTNREIATSLKVSEKSIETYRSRVRGKLGIRSRADFLKVARASALADE
jgi:two-component system, NarL family, response regulator NreC